MKRAVFFLLLCLIAIGATAEAKTKKHKKVFVPLMPTSFDTYRAPRKELASVPNRHAVLYSEDYGPQPQSTGGVPSLGAEFGALGRRNAAVGGVLGMQIQPVGRVFAEFPISSRILLRPSFGYYGSSSGESGVSVSQSDYELGLGAFLKLHESGRFHPLLGISQRLAIVTSTITAFGNASSNPTGFFYRVGPAGSVEVDVSRPVSVVLNAEINFEVNPPVRPYAGLSAGLLVRLR